MSSVVGGKWFPLAPTRSDEVRMRFAPRVGVARSIKLGNHSNTTQTGVFNHLLDIFWSVNMLWRVSSFFCQLRHSFKNNWEGLIIHDMPMKDIEFVVSHGIQISKHDGQRLKMTSRVQQYTTMEKPGRILNFRLVDEKIPSVCEINKLGKGF